jgi:hypothetical protein
MGLYLRGISGDRIVCEDAEISGGMLLRKFVVTDIFLSTGSDGQWLQLLMDSEYRLQYAILDCLSKLKL